MMRPNSNTPAVCPSVLIRTGSRRMEAVSTLWPLTFQTAAVFMVPCIGQSTEHLPFREYMIQDFFVADERMATNEINLLSNRVNASAGGYCISMTLKADTSFGL